MRAVRAEAQAAGAWEVRGLDGNKLITAPNTSSTRTGWQLGLTVTAGPATSSTCSSARVSHLEVDASPLKRSNAWPVRSDGEAVVIVHSACGTD